jgi:signal transduction histidine kinase
LSAVLLEAAVLLDSIRKGNHAVNQEMTWTGSGGKRHDVSLSASLLTDEADGEAMGIVFVAHDITTRKQAEERLRRYSAELREANKKLETLDKLKSDFVSTVSHELRTPLTSIKANAELILMKPLLQDEKKTKLLRTINDESDRLGRLINDLLDLSRIEAGTVQWRSQQVSLSDVIPLSVESVLPLAQNKGLQLTTSLDSALPAIPGDKDRLVQLITNLLSNAIKFTPSGGAITVKAYEEQRPVPRLVISVTDTGVGIPQEDIELIFDKFHRSSHHLTDQTEGTGLGLPIARQIVEHHRGDIWATSTPGSGSTFTVTLPLGKS